MFFFNFLRSFVISFSWKLDKVKTNIINNNLPLFPYLAKFYFSIYQDTVLANQIAVFFKMLYLKKEANNEVFGMQINTEDFCKLKLSFWVCIARHAQSTQNKKFPYICNSPKNVGNEINFLATNKYQNFLQIDSITLGVRSLPYPMYPQ